MITFDNLLFLDHPHVKGAIMTQIRGLKEKGGKTISVVCGEGMYSTGKGGVREAVSKVEDASSFEVAIFDQAGNFIGADNDLVLGWQSREDIDKLIQIHS